MFPSVASTYCPLSSVIRGSTRLNRKPSCCISFIGVSLSGDPLRLASPPPDTHTHTHTQTHRHTDTQTHFFFFFFFFFLGHLSDVTLRPCEPRDRPRSKPGPPPGPPAEKRKGGGSTGGALSGRRGGGSAADPSSPGPVQDNETKSLEAALRETRRAENSPPIRA